MREEMLSELFVRQYQALLGVAFQLSRNEEDALDLMQDLAETIARDDRPASSIQHPMAFFRTCLRNAHINTGRRAAREIPTEQEAFFDRPSGESVEEDVLNREAMEWLRKELATYSPEIREAFFQYYFDGYPMEEIAKRMNINKNTLSQRFVRIREKLSRKAANQSLFLTLTILFLLRPR